MSPSFSSPPPSPLLNRLSSSTPRAAGSSAHAFKAMPLKLASAANIIVRLRRTRAAAKAHHIASTSGDAPRTHPALAADGAVLPRRVPLEERVTFVCRDGVDGAKLLRGVRALLLQQAADIGANVLVDEQWQMTICGPRHRSDGSFKVHVDYYACGARSQTQRDPQQPVALENIKDVPGLMTIVSRSD
ncbi:uncharacterized protein BXZ73DRAFT_41435 [Epithele typhae]|uniref:uncharacterized protein n=1 Tax=Epithele typhae TaxID=378194 RepID=UPI002007950D|nr:uncharacterized protein BXZ73DRAFT_41435 [Epithele typhae]KAH9941654.1 hypothetical protein BXZ73DRAFT_41435 [Epithele typhae]